MFKQLELILKSWFCCFLQPDTTCLVRIILVRFMCILLNIFEWLKSLFLKSFSKTTGSIAYCIKVTA